MRYFIQQGEHAHEVQLERTDEGLVAHVDGTRYPIDLAVSETTGLYSLIVAHAAWTYACRFEGQEAVLSFHDRDIRLTVEDERERQTRLLTGGGRTGARGAKVRSVMPGVVKELRVAVGDTVAEGGPLLILEAMKMENEIRAPAAGVVQAVHVGAGEAVEKGAPLIDIAPPEATSA